MFNKFLAIWVLGVWLGSGLCMTAFADCEADYSTIVNFFRNSFPGDYAHGNDPKHLNCNVSLSAKRDSLEITIVENYKDKSFTLSRDVCRSFPSFYESYVSALRNPINNLIKLEFEDSVHGTGWHSSKTFTFYKNTKKKIKNLIIETSSGTQESANGPVTGPYEDSYGCRFIK